MSSQENSMRNGNSLARENSKIKNGDMRANFQIINFMVMAISQTKSKRKISKDNLLMDSCTRAPSSKNQEYSVENLNTEKYMALVPSSGVKVVAMKENSKITV